MLLSMTGFGVAQSHDGDVDIEIEVRTINNRYLKINLRATEGLAALEANIESTVRESLKRGTIQVNVRVSRRARQEDFQINSVALESYRKQLETLARDWGIAEAPSLDSLLELPGVVAESQQRLDPEHDWSRVKATLQQALSEVCEMRTREGEAMARDLDVNIKQIREHLSVIETRAPEVVQDYRQRITDRVNQHLAALDHKLTETDLAREIAIFSERSDMGEEIVRLRSHLDQFEKTTKLPESAGRKLDFITQEMFREANTIGSKANDGQIAMHVVEIKGAIERIREMVQNIE